MCMLLIMMMSFVWFGYFCSLRVYFIYVITVLITNAFHFLMLLSKCSALNQLSLVTHMKTVNL